MYINTYIYIHAFSHIYIACMHAFAILNIKINNTGKLHEETILLNCNATALASAASYRMLFSIRTIHVVYQAIKLKRRNLTVRFSFCPTLNAHARNSTSVVKRSKVMKSVYNRNCNYTARTLSEKRTEYSTFNSLACNYLKEDRNSLLLKKNNQEI